MFRNEKTGKFESAKEVEKTPEEQIAELEAQIKTLKEEQEKKELAAKEDAKLTRKAAADVVTTAIKERLEQEAATRKAKREAYQAYLEACDAAESRLKEKKTAESKALTEFCSEYGPYHETIQVGDMTYNCSYDTNQISLLDPWKAFWGF